MGWLIDKHTFQSGWNHQTDSDGQSFMATPRPPRKEKRIPVVGFSQLPTKPTNQAFTNLIKAKVLTQNTIIYQHLLIIINYHYYMNHY